MMTCPRPCAACILAVLVACGTPKAMCTSANCNGCCTVAGTCESGFDNAACGFHGAECQTCASTEMCFVGGCGPRSGSGGGGGSAVGDPGTEIAAVRSAADSDAGL